MTTKDLDFFQRDSWLATLTGDLTLTFSHETSAIGKFWAIVLLQDGAGGHSITWPADVQNPPDTNTNASGVTFGVFFYDGTKHRGTIRTDSEITALAKIVLATCLGGLTISESPDAPYEGASGRTSFTLSSTVQSFILFIDGLRVNAADITHTPGSATFTLGFAPVVGSHMEAMGV